MLILVWYRAYNFTTALVTTILFSVFMNLTSLGASYKWNHIVCLFVMDILLSLMSSRFVHAIVNVLIFFLFLAE